MKRKILSVLAVFIAVIITATALAACDAESGENGELYEFVASEKAAAQVQSIAEVLGGYDFVGLSGVQST